MIQLDGNYGEAGGQIVRTALALSTLTQQPFTVNDIRKGRCKPGLKAQHLNCIKSLQQLCNAEVKGADLASTEITFIPKKYKPKTISIDIGTAGSITLLLQSLLIPAIFAEKKTRFKITGGTDTKWSMPIDYLTNILLPQLEKYADIETKLLQRGYFPQGQGKVDITIKPKYNLTNIDKAPKINLIQQHQLLQIKGISNASSNLEKAQVAERQAKAAKHYLTKLNCPTQIRTEYSNTPSTGSAIVLFAIFGNENTDPDNPIIIGSDSLGEKNKRAETVGQEAAERLINEINYKAPIDRYLADNLAPIMGLIPNSKIKSSFITNHTLTNIYVTEKFLNVKFKVDKKNNIISV